MRRSEEAGHRMTLGRPRGEEAPGCEVVVAVELLSLAGTLIAESVPAGRYCIVTDTQVAKLHAKRLLASLSAVGLSASVHTFAAGEWNKSRESWGELTDELLRVGPAAEMAIIALGGGVAADLGGFLAATLRPGVPLILIPTTLLAMLESPARERATLDTPVGRDRVGALQSPRLALIDPLLLETLPGVHVIAGLAAAVRHAIVGDAGQFARLAGGADPIIARDPEAVSGLIVRSLEIQAELLSRGNERGGDVVLEFGDRVARALGQVTGYTWLHGERLAVGLVLEAAIGEQAGVTTGGVVDKIREALGCNRLPTELEEDVDPQRFMDALAREAGGAPEEMSLALVREIGTPAPADGGGWLHSVSQETVRAALFG